MVWKKFDADILLTTACPVACDFCVYGSNPDGEWMSETTIRKVVEEYTKNDFGIRICGGEPFYDLKKLEKCVDIVLEYQKPEEVLIITSGFFGNNRDQTSKALDLLSRKKLDTIVISIDRWHLPKVPLSSIQNIIDKAKQKVIIRLTYDEKSYELVDDVIELIIKNNLKLEPHSCYGVYGKAELLSPDLIKDKEKREAYLQNVFKKLGKAAKDYIEQSPKRAQKKFASRFYPTTFPNGNIYADSQCTKGTLMGNINERSLKTMIDDFSKTLPGYILWSKNSNCSKRMPKLNPPATDYCDYCRNQPLTEEMPAESIGRQFVKLTPKNLKIPKTDRELLLSFDFKEQELKKNDDIIALLLNLKTRFTLSKPIPRCILGSQYTEIMKDLPKNCYDCRELFSVQNEKILSCEPIGKEGPKIKHMEDRNQIWEYFNTLRLMKEPNDTCKKCLYFRRKQCDGLCYR